MLRHLGTAEPCRIPQVHCELGTGTTAFQDESAALRRRLGEGALLIQLVAALYVFVRFAERLKNVAPNVLDGAGLEVARHFLGGQAVAFRKGVDLGVDALLSELAVGARATVGVASRVQRHGAIAGQMGWRDRENEAPSQ